MKSFLANALAIARQIPSLDHSSLRLPREIVACIGNQAADADSMISSICYSYLRQRQIQADGIAEQLSKFYLPVMPIPRSDLVLRRDVEVLLQQSDINITDLVCIDDCQFKQLFSDFNLRFVLLDHNKLQHEIYDQLPLRDEADYQLVEEILDHHSDCNAHTYCCGDRRLIAYDDTSGHATAGSTCTLVYERYVSASSRPGEASQAEEAATSLLTEDVATLLMGVITLDTINMDPVVDKGTHRDNAALLDLETKVKCIQRQQLFELLSHCKTDISFWTSLSAADAMRLDYKVFFSDKSKSKIGMSAVLLPLVAFFEKADMVASIEDVFSKSQLKYFVVMTFTNIDAPRREVAIFCKDADLLRDIDLFLCGTKVETSLSNETISAAGFGYIPRNDSVFNVEGYGEAAGGFRWRAYDQQNLKCSRKQLAPLLVKYLP